MRSPALAFLIAPCLLITSQAAAQENGRVKQWLEQRKQSAVSSALLQNRPYEIFIPSSLPQEGKRSMIVALHGGSGWAAQFERSIHLNDVAEKYGIIILYLSGTQASPAMAENRLAWNAGSCCGMPARKNVDDVAYIQKATENMARQHGVDPQQIFVTGHSNGAMMSARMMCESSLFRSAVLISGALNTHPASCPIAKGKKLLAIHGDLDENYPYNGDVGTKSTAGTDFVSQESSKDLFEKSGARYQIMLVKGAEHKTETIDRVLENQGTRGLPETIVHFFGLDQ